MSVIQVNKCYNVRKSISLGSVNIRLYTTNLLVQKSTQMATDCGRYSGFYECTAALVMLHSAVINRRVDDEHT